MPYAKKMTDAALQRLAQENIISIERNGNVGMVRLLRTRDSEIPALDLF
jgi:DNA-binding GntR family transcriptional regulator